MLRSLDPACTGSAGLVCRDRSSATPTPATADELAARIAYAHEHADRIGRTATLDIPFMPGALAKREGRTPSTQEIVDDCGRLQELGVTYR